MTFRNVVISFILVGLFLISLINFGAEFGINNQANSSILDDPRLNSTRINLDTDLGKVQDTAETQRNSTEKEPFVEPSGSLLFGTIIGAGKVFTSMLFGLFNITFGLIFDVIFGGSTAFGLVLIVLAGILLITIIFLLWRLLKAGE